MLFGQSYAGLESLSVYRASVVQRMRTLLPAHYVGSMRKPIRATLFGCCALGASGHNAPLPNNEMNSGRFIRSSSQLEDDGPQSITFRWSHRLRV
jgi:hypothetical protein